MKFFWLVILQIVITIAANAQNVVNLQISESAPTVLRVTGKNIAPQRKFVFVDSYANAANLLEKTSEMQFFDSSNNKIAFQKTANVYETAAPATSYSYLTRLDSLKVTAQAAHVSSLKQDGGFLMLTDLLPENENPLKINLDLPPSWKISANAEQNSANEFSVKNINETVFHVGELETARRKFAGGEIYLSKSGAWSFSNDELLEMATQILTHHRQTFGALPFSRVNIALAPFEQSFAGEQWEAETRGANVVLLAGNTSFKSRALSKLHEQLRHELFHLWLPNALNLRGDYAWFYEGFTIYQALKTGIELKYIRFADFLEVLSRAFDAVRRAPVNRTLTLLEASKIRWQNAEFVYAKGMMTAFLCDINLLANGKKLNSVFRELYDKHKKPNPPTDAAAAVLKVLKNHSELRSIIEKFVETANNNQWQTELTLAGIQPDASSNRFIKLIVAPKLNGRQKKVLTALGYEK